MNSKIILLMLAFTFFMTNTKGQILENINLTDYRKEAYLFDSDSLLKAKTTTILSDRKKKVLEEDDEYPYIRGCFFGQFPQFPGGDRKLMEYINTNLRPIDPLVEGQVVVRFVIDKDGTIQKVKVIRSLSEEADAEAVRVVNSMPKWIPAMDNNHYIPMDFRLPIRFGDAKSKKKKR